MTKGAVGETMQKGQKKREVATKRRQETDKKERENRRLHRVKILKYLLERH